MPALALKALKFARLSIDEYGRNFYLKWLLFGTLAANDWRVKGIVFAIPTTVDPRTPPIKITVRPAVNLIRRAVIVIPALPNPPIQTMHMPNPGVPADIQLAS